MIGWIGAIVRFIVSAFVLLGVDFLLPNVDINGFTNALIASIVIAILAYIVEEFLGDDISPQARGLTGFISAAIVIYLTGLILGGMQVTIIGSLLAALVIGIIDSFIPTELR